jgi:hypothetical protein
MDAYGSAGTLERERLNIGSGRHVQLEHGALIPAAQVGPIALAVEFPRIGRPD